MIRFSIIVPVFNCATHLHACVHSVLNQAKGDFDFEILLVDDCSTDSSPKVIQQCSNASPTRIQTLKTERNGGPGIARNLGIENAQGNWLLFLDCDDQLSSESLLTLSKSIGAKENSHCDIFGFDWSYDPKSSTNNGKRGGRYDFKSLLKEKDDMLKDAVALGMDGSVIYTAINLEFLKTNEIKFKGGIHEDVDFIFKVYWQARELRCIEKQLYIKNDRSGSLVNSISENHLQGYFRAYREIFDFIKGKGCLENFTEAYYIGLVGVVATRVKEISNHELAQDKADKLYSSLYRLWSETVELLGDFEKPILKTKYSLIANYFFEVMEKKVVAATKPNALLLRAFIDDIRNKSWSCYDLHNSIFLAPDEVRTCCKRFFVDGKMKGDVTIALADQNDPASISPVTILNGKKDLYGDINRGQCEECDGCPFLEFKDWGYIEDLKVEHLSLEYHSVCNMKCSYCNDTYYGGATADYDVERLVSQLFSDGSMDNLQSVVWGGGEPSLGASFDSLIDLIAKESPELKQRILTNCVKYSEKVNALIENNQANILTSIDAGTKDTFQLIRGSTQFTKVFKNLSKYASSDYKNVSIKYIFTEDNYSQGEIQAFVDLIIKHDLLQCTFQISSDFTREKIDIQSAISMAMLYGLLIEANCRLVYFDELLRQRLVNGSDETDTIIKAALKNLNLAHIIADRTKSDTVIIWGAGQQTQLLLEYTNFFQHVGVSHIVDSTLSKVGTSFMGYDVLHPESLLESDTPVLISAVQNSPLIYKKYIELGLQDSRLIKGLVL
ncbi:glycosyltransferase [Gammaproteobacteria bacterium]|nr:glycosyltransferase [Gammaproteobacteria bacterium]